MTFIDTAPASLRLAVELHEHDVPDLDHVGRLVDQLATWHLGLLFPEREAT
jgi:hypothetical protein